MVGFCTKSSFFDSGLHPHRAILDCLGQSFPFFTRLLQILDFNFLFLDDGSQFWNICIHPFYPIQKLCLCFGAHAVIPLCRSQHGIDRLRTHRTFCCILWVLTWFALIFGEFLVERITRNMPSIVITPQIYLGWKTPAHYLITLFYIIRIIFLRTGIVIFALYFNHLHG